MDKNEFFREATVRICGNLDIEQALYSTLRFLRSSIPIDIIILEYFDESLGAMRTLSKATPDGGEVTDQVAPISDQAKQEARQK